MGSNDSDRAAGFENVLYEVRAPTAWITVSRPQKLNALNRRTVEEIVGALEAALADGEVRAVVLTGDGEKAFVAGADIEEMSKLTPEEAQEFSRFLQASLDRIERAPKPVIAAVNGFALGGGCELALACHVRLAADRARFGQPEVGLGLIPGAAGTVRLPRVVGRGRALDLILTGEMIDADQAERMGLVSKVVPSDNLGAAAAAYAANLAKKSPTALRRALESVLSAEEIPHGEAQRLEAGLFGLCFATEDMREGTAAFLEKRKPEFPGR
jgi:enoyl-CoA hydratase